jgi:hypothetical protein
MAKVVLAVAPPESDTLPAVNGKPKGKAGAAAGRKTKEGKGQERTVIDSEVTPQSAAARWAALTPSGYAQLLVASKVLGRSGLSYGRALRHGSRCGGHTQ